MKQKMKLVAAIVAGLGALSAQAGVITATAVKTYAVENFGTAAAAVKLPIVSYQNAQPITGTALNPNTFFVDLSLDQGAVYADVGGVNFTVAPSLILTNGTDTLTGTLVTSFASPSTVTKLRYSFTVNDGKVYPAGISTFNLGVATAAYAAKVDTILGVDGGACVPAANNVLNMTVKMFDSSGTNQVDTIGTYAETAVVARSARGINGTTLSSAAYTTAESTKIDVTVLANPGKVLTNTGLASSITKVNIGSVTFKDNAAAPVTLGGVVPYTVATAGYNGVDVTVAGDFSAAASVGLYSDAACTTAIAGATSTINTGKTSAALNIPVGTPIATAVPTFVCAVMNGTASINPTQYSGYATLNKTTGSKEGADYASGSACPVNLYALAYNGATVYIRNYNPASTKSSGWAQYTRIINTGGVAANLRGWFINADGTTTTAAALATSAIPVGGNVTLSNAAVEAAIGAPSATANATSNPRLVVTATTGSLRVQNYIVMPSGLWFETSGGQSENANTSPSQQ